MTHYTIQLELSDRLRQTPITADDIREILGLLGHSKTEIVAAQIQVSQSCATVHWTDETAIAA